MTTLLGTTLLLPLVGAAAVRLAPRSVDVRPVGLVASLATFLVSLSRLLAFDRSTASYQYVLDTGTHFVPASSNRSSTGGVSATPARVAAYIASGYG